MKSKLTSSFPDKVWVFSGPNPMAWSWIPCWAGSEFNSWEMQHCFHLALSKIVIAPSTGTCRFWVHPSDWWVVLKSTHLLVGFLLKIGMLGNWFNHASLSFYFFLLKIRMLGNWFNHPSYHFTFFGLSLALFVSHGFKSLWNVKKIIWLIF
jgi:hypothetical protein